MSLIYAKHSIAKDIDCSLHLCVGELLLGRNCYLVFRLEVALSISVGLFRQSQEKKTRPS